MVIYCPMLMKAFYWWDRIRLEKQKNDQNEGGNKPVCNKVMDVSIMCLCFHSASPFCFWGMCLCFLTTCSMRGKCFIYFFYRVYQTWKTFVIYRSQSHMKNSCSSYWCHLTVRNIFFLTGVRYIWTNQNKRHRLRYQTFLG